jgi:hypothetical protein
MFPDASGGGFVAVTRDRGTHEAFHSPSWFNAVAILSAAIPATQLG